jgi:hypothetical protein
VLDWLDWVVLGGWEGCTETYSFTWMPRMVLMMVGGGWGRAAGRMG